MTKIAKMVCKIHLQSFIIFIRYFQKKPVRTEIKPASSA